MKLPTVLAVDTSGPYVTADLWGVPTEAPVYEDMPRGQAERLMPMCSEVLEKAGISWRDLDAIGVGIGPGNFTGIRISVSAARGLSLSLGIPAIGISGFEWLHQGFDTSGRLAISLPAPRDQAYVQVFVGGKPVAPPALVSPGARHPALEQPNLMVVGYRAGDIAAPHSASSDETLWTDRRPHMMASTIGLIASNKLRDAGGKWTERPAPLYVRAPDAAPSSDPPPVILP